MAADFIDNFADCLNIAFGAFTMTVAIITFSSSGRAWIFIHNDLRTYTGVAGHGGAWTKEATTERSNGWGSWWFRDVSPGTDDTAITAADAISCIGDCGGLVTGSDNVLADSGKHEADQDDNQIVTEIDIHPMALDHRESGRRSLWASKDLDPEREPFTVSRMHDKQ